MSIRLMSHVEAWESLPAAALGALDPPDDVALREHLGGCVECEAELTSLREAASALALAAPARPLTAEREAAIGARLLERVRANRGKMISLPETLPRENRPPAWGRSEWLAIAASLLLVASFGAIAMLMRERASLRDTILTTARETVAAELGMDTLRETLADRDKLLAGLTGKDMDMVTLTSNEKREAWALMFWNRQTNGWTFVAHNLPTPSPGHTYQLWLVTADSKISAGTFTPEANGNATVRATYALPRSALKAVAVTEEPTGGVPQPTGPFVVIGAEGTAPR